MANIAPRRQIGPWPLLLSIAHTMDLEALGAVATRTLTIAPDSSC